MVRFENVSKRYRRGAERLNLRAAIPWGWGEPPVGNDHWALHEVSFELEGGGSIGIIGPNGAGKSTALKLIARIIAPTAGGVTVAGRTASLIELGAGFHLDLTGRENIDFSAAVLGIHPKVLRARLDAIIDFAGIGAYLDTPVKRYSSGMLARLGFAVASHVDADILVLDEVLAVGDAAFQRRCHDRIRELRQGGAALIYVTHALPTVPMLCDTALLLVNGRVQARGAPEEVLVAYERHQADGTDGPVDGEVPFHARLSNPEIAPGEDLEVLLELKLPTGFPDGHVLLAVRDARRQVVFASSSEELVRFDQPGRWQTSCRLARLDLQPGHYDLEIGFFGDAAAPALDSMRSLTFTVKGQIPGPGYGPMKVDCEWLGHAIGRDGD